MRDSERQPELLHLWLQRSEQERTENQVLAFYGQLVRTRPELLKRGHGDPYQQLKVDLDGHILTPV